MYGKRRSHADHGAWQAIGRFDWYHGRGMGVVGRRPPGFPFSLRSASAPPLVCTSLHSASIFLLLAMGCVPSQHQREEAALGPPSPAMDASEHAQDLVLFVRKPVHFNLCDGPIQPAQKVELKATQMIKRDVNQASKITVEQCIISSAKLPASINGLGFLLRYTNQSW